MSICVQNMHSKALRKSIFYLVKEAVLKNEEVWNCIGGIENEPT